MENPNIKLLVRIRGYNDSSQTKTLENLESDKNSSRLNTTSVKHDRNYSVYSTKKSNTSTSRHGSKSPTSKSTNFASKFSKK